jgi:hypothetical protein
LKNVQQLLSGAILILGIVDGILGGLRHSAESSATSELVQKLKSDKTTDDARKQLLRLGKSEPDVKRYLAAQLPSMIEKGPKSCPPSDIEDVIKRWEACPWYNAVKLAGQLKIGEAAPALAQWVNWRNRGPTGLSLEARLVFYPAARSLADSKGTLTSKQQAKP